MLSSFQLTPRSGMGEAETPWPKWGTSRSREVAETEKSPVASTAGKSFGLLPQTWTPSSESPWGDPSKPKHPRPFNSRWATVLGEQLLLAQAQTQMDLEQGVQEKNANISVGTLDLAPWWKGRPKGLRKEDLDERALALVALASQTRPAHMCIIAENVSLTDLKMLSMWSRLQQIRFTGSTITSIVGIEGCYNLQEVHMTFCKKLCDASPLGNCQELRLVDLRGCEELAKLGDPFCLEDCQNPSGSLFRPPCLQRVNLVGCSRIPAEQLLLLYRGVQDIVLPNAKSATQCAAKLTLADRTQFTLDAKTSAETWLRQNMRSAQPASIGQPPVNCSWAKFKELMEDLIVATNYARSMGVPESALQDAEMRRREAKLAIHIGQVMTAEQIEQLKARSGRSAGAKMRRCYVLIQYMKIRRLEGVTRNDFCMVLCKALDEPRHMLSRIYNSMDVEREGVLTQEDFDRLAAGFDGPAMAETVDQFREWAHENFGGLKGLFAAIVRQNGKGALAEFVDYAAFAKALQRLGWQAKGETSSSSAEEIFVLLNDHKPKVPFITENDFMLIDWLYFSQVEKFKQWIQTRHGDTKRAFRAMDSNRSDAISLSEFRKYLIDYNVMPGVGCADCERFFRWIDLNDSNSVTHKEFDRLANMDTYAFLGDLSNFRAAVLQKWGTFRTAFYCMSNIKYKDAKAHLGKEAKKARKEGTRFVCYEQFRQAALGLEFKPEHDLRLLFRYLDFDMHGTIELEDFMALPVATVGDTRQCFAKVKAYLTDTWGSFADSYSGLSRKAQLQRDEEKYLKENPDAEQPEQPDPSAKAKAKAKGKK